MKNLTYNYNQELSLSVHIEKV